MVKVAGLGYHFDDETHPAESIALIRKVSIYHPNSPDLPYLPAQLLTTLLGLLRPRNPRLPTHNHTRQNLPPPLLRAHLLHAQVPDHRIRGRLDRPRTRHRGLLPDHLPVLADCIWLGQYDPSW